MAALDATPGADRRHYAESSVIRDEYLQRRNRALLGMIMLPLALPAAGALRLWLVRGR